MDFYLISAQMKPNGSFEIKPKFLTTKRSDLMIRSRDFYAVWIEEKKLWSTDEDDVIKAIDKDLDLYVKENKDKFPNGYTVKYMWDADSGSIDRWHKYCQQQQRDHFVALDSKLIFANQETTKESYATRKLSYPLEAGPIDAYDRLMSVLYSPEERRKLEWAVGAIVSGDSVDIQKFVVLYGDKGTGKGTFLKIVEKLFEGYCKAFEAKVVGAGKSDFALEAFKDNPLVAIDSDGDLSRIEDNTRLNAITSHEILPINPKYEKVYTDKIRSFLFIGSNKPVKITDAKSGLLRRLIDVNPTGNTVPGRQYKRLMNALEFELGAIAKHCLDVYLEKPDRYDNYIPISMLSTTNDFYNFVMENIHVFKKNDGISMKVGWEMYKAYCEDARVPYPFSQRIFRDEMHNYFNEYYDRYTLSDGTRVRSYYKGFKIDKFELKPVEEDDDDVYILDLKEQPSLLDEYLANCPAQEAYYDGEGGDRPATKWVNCKTKLKDIDTSKLHYILPKGHPNLIRLDFDLKDANGTKDPDLNLKEASKWPKTYAERSKSGAGIHLYYIYSGDVSRLSRFVSDQIEIKVQSGKSAIRRRLTTCNDIPIATISSGLPLKGEEKVINDKSIMNERQLRTFIKRALNKEHHGATKPEVDFIFKVLSDKYASGDPYDVSDMRNAVLAFAASSTHQSQAAVKLVRQMHFKSDDQVDIDEEELIEAASDEEKPITFFDFEVYPNFNCIVTKVLDVPVMNAYINPSSELVKSIFSNGRMVGHNCRRYDNHIAHAIILGEGPRGVFNVSQSIINKNEGFYAPAYGYSYTDTYDYPVKKQSLKKWEIELGIPHQEMDIPWDEDVPEELWKKVIEYCKNDVLATEAVFKATQSDFLARQILADLTNMTPNDTTNTLTAKLIFGNDKNPQRKFRYRDLSQPVLYDEYGNPYPEEDLIFRAWNGERSREPFFPGYTFEKGKSIYRGEEIGEGGKVYAEPGVYCDIPVLDITSMHPSSIIAERLFGDYTDIFAELVQARVYIKHAVKAKEKGDEDGYLENLANVRALTHIGDKFTKYLDDYEVLKNLPQALKIAINSVYGLTAASFSNPFRDSRNKDNIVAKRGALFMTDLKFAVQEKGYTVAHIKTDSIKIPNATPEIRKFVEDFGKMYGYSFEVEDDYDRMALVNDAVYIAKEKNGRWTATGKQFQVPFVFKTLFSKEPMTFKDYCFTQTSNSALYLDFNEDLGKDEHNYAFIGKVGSFCPVKPGTGGGELYWKKNDKYNSVSGTIKEDKKTKWRFKEEETMTVLHLEDQVDISYYTKLADEAVADIEALTGGRVTIDEFVNSPNLYLSLIGDDDLPF